MPRSTSPIPVRDRLIFALDVPTVEAAKALVDTLGDSVEFYKLGLQLFMTGGYFELLEWLAARGKKIFVDIKLFDVPETVKLAVSQLRHRPVDFVTIHGYDSMMQAAVAAKGDVKILAVTVLTSLDKHDLRGMGFEGEVEDLVLTRAVRAQELGCDGVIASGLEAAALRKRLNPAFLIVTPGIRPAEDGPTADDQKRIVTVPQAFANGADHIVVGRPIRDAPDPRLKAEAIQAQIAAAFNGN